MKKISIFLRDIDKINLQKLARFEGENMSVLIRRLIKAELSRSYMTNQKILEKMNVSNSENQHKLGRKYEEKNNE